MLHSTHDIKRGLPQKFEDMDFILLKAEQTSTSKMQALVRI